MYKFFKILILLLCNLNTIHAKKLGENYAPFIFGTSPDNPPYEFSPHTSMVGIDIDVINAIGKKLNKHPIIGNHMSFSNLLLEAKRGKFDAVIASTTPTEERKKHFDFTKSYFKSKIALLALKKSNVNSLKDLKNKILGMQSSTTYEALAKNYIKEHNAIIKTKSLTNMLILFEELKRGYIDAILTEEVQANYMARKYSQFRVIILEEFPAAEYAILLPKNSPYLNQINAAIDELSSEGELEKIKLKWLNQ
ncbi:MAG: ABC transporter substrate-binding protein [Rickettsiaceae bacterium]|nr:ABC transporter substrate-binding protein [Rickettsiaceae bacterium]